MDEIPFTKEELSTFDAYTKTLPFAMDCMGYTEDAWLEFLWRNVTSQKLNREGTWRHYLDRDGDLNIDNLLNWSRTKDGQHFWSSIAIISGLKGFGGHGGIMI